MDLKAAEAGVLVAPAWRERSSRRRPGALRSVYAGIKCASDIQNANSSWSRRFDEKVHTAATAVDLNLPRFRRHPGSHESAVGVCHGKAETTDFHEGLQSRGG